MIWCIICRAEDETSFFCRGSIWCPCYRRQFLPSIDTTDQYGKWYVIKNIIVLLIPCDTSIHCFILYHSSCWFYYYGYYYSIQSLIIIICHLFIYILSWLSDSLSRHAGSLSPFFTCRSDLLLPPLLLLPLLRWWDQYFIQVDHTSYAGRWIYYYYISIRHILINRYRSQWLVKPYHLNGACGII